MRIIFVLNNMYPNGRASSARVRQYGKGFVNNGVETLVLMPWARIPFHSKKINPDSGVDQYGVQYKSMAGSSRRNCFFLIRKSQDLFGPWRTLRWLKKNLRKDDFVIIYEGEPTWYKEVVALCKKKRIKVGIELNEYPYGTGIETSVSIQKREIMLKEIFPNLDFILCISQELVLLAKQYTNIKGIIKVPIMVEEQLMAHDIAPKVPYIVHTGSLTEQKDGIVGMIKAFGIATTMIDKQFKIILTGDIEESPQKEELKTIIKKYGIENRVIFTGWVDNEKLRALQKNCFLTIINKNINQQNRYCFSTKLSEYCSFARPIIITSYGEATCYLKDGFNAMIIAPHHPEQIAEKIVYALTHPDEMRRMGEEAFKLTLKEFNCEHQARLILKHLKKL